MKDFQKRIDEMVSKILAEEIEKKHEEVSEKLYGDQHKLDVAKPKGILNKKDFDKLHKKETKEDLEYGDYEGDESAENKAEMLSRKEPKYRGTRFASFNDEDWFDEHNYPYSGNFDFDYDEEEFDEFDPYNQKYGGKMKWFSSDKSGKEMFDRYKGKFGPLKIRHLRDLEETETQEGNEFSGNRADAIKKGLKSFDVDGKTYPVTGNKEKTNEAKEEKWIQKTDMKKGALRKKLGVPEGEKIPKSKLKELKKDLMKKGEGDKKLSSSDAKLLKQVNLALTLGGLKENKNSLSLTENELIDLIENIVNEQKTKDNIKLKTPIGLKEVEKANKGTEKVSNEYVKSVTKKLKDYMKDGSKGEFDESPQDFPKNNYQLSKMKEKTKKYHPSDAVDEYVDAFAYPGQTNLVFDEIKPDDKKIKKYLVGDSTTGNATKDKDGKALGNVVPSEVGEKFMKNYEENLYGAEQMNTSYKRQPQPVDVEGSEKMQGSLKSIKKGSNNKANKILSQLESTDDKKEKLIKEDMSKMMNLLNYDRKTQ